MHEAGGGSLRRSLGGPWAGLARILGSLGVVLGLASRRSGPSPMWVCGAAGLGLGWISLDGGLGRMGVVWGGLLAVVGWPLEWSRVGLGEFAARFACASGRTGLSD